MALLYLILPVTSAFLSGLATYFALKLLFLPRTPIKIGPFIHLGIVQRYFPLFVMEVINFIKKEVLTKSTVDQLITDKDLENKIVPILEIHMNAFIDNMKIKNPMIGMFLSDQLLDTFKGQAREEFVKMLPSFKTMASDQLLDSPEVIQFLEQKLRSFDLIELKKRVWRKIAPTLIIGGTLFGLSIGLIQLGLLAWLG